MGKELKANPDVITKYAGDLSRYGPNATMHSQFPLTQMTQLAMEAFSGVTDAGQFQEGSMIKSSVENSAAQFGAFLREVAQGFQAIGCAAQVCADTYRHTDGEAADNIDIVRFAFADSGVGRPAGLDKTLGTKSLADLEADAVANGSGGFADAIVNPDGGYTVHPSGGMTVTIYPDGSTRMILNTSEGGSSSSVTEIYDANGKLMSKSTEVLSSDSQGGTTHAVSEGMNPKYAMTTTTTTAADGTITIVTTQNGRQIGHTTVIPPNETPPASNQEGPMQKALDDFGPMNTGIHDYGSAGPVSR